jgi:NAD(P)-dependent dehydrogenase (short-subunit alcohol dehydrogenase family)
MVAFADQGRGGPQILVNNAGGGGHVEPHFPDATPSQWSATLDLNLRSAMLATQIAGRPYAHGRRRGSGERRLVRRWVSPPISRRSTAPRRRVSSALPLRSRSCKSG